jgi:hypothetical protein
MRVIPETYVLTEMALCSTSMLFDMGVWRPLGWGDLDQWEAFYNDPTDPNDPSAPVGYIETYRAGVHQRVHRLAPDSLRLPETFDARPTWGDRFDRPWVDASGVQHDGSLDENRWEESVTGSGITTSWSSGPVVNIQGDGTQQLHSITNKFPIKSGSLRLEATFEIPVSDPVVPGAARWWGLEVAPLYAAADSWVLRTGDDSGVITVGFGADTGGGVPAFTAPLPGLSQLADTTFDLALVLDMWDQSLQWWLRYDNPVTNERIPWTLLHTEFNVAITEYIGSFTARDDNTAGQGTVAWREIFLESPTTGRALDQHDALDPLGDGWLGWSTSNRMDGQPDGTPHCLDTVRAVAFPLGSPDCCFPHWQASGISNSLTQFQADFPALANGTVTDPSVLIFDGHDDPDDLYWGDGHDDPDDVYSSDGHNDPANTYTADGHDDPVPAPPLIFDGHDDPDDMYTGDGHDDPAGGYVGDGHDDPDDTYAGDGHDEG